MNYRVAMSAAFVVAVMVAGLVAFQGPLPSNPSQQETSELTTSVPSQSIPEPTDLPVPTRSTSASGLEALNGTALNYLPNNPSGPYHQTWEAWKGQVSVHAVAVSMDQQWLGVAGGYLMGEEVQIFRYNTTTASYNHVWTAGSGLFRGDVVSLDWGDIDKDGSIEVIAGSMDGRFYVFEHRAYTPGNYMVNQFDLVFKSRPIGAVFGLSIDDLDHDGFVEVITGSWDGFVRVWELGQLHHSRTIDSWSVNPEWVAEVGQRISALVTLDSDGDGLREILVGTREGLILTYEAGGVVLSDDVFWYDWSEDAATILYNSTQEFNGTFITGSILDLVAGQLDTDVGHEVGVAVQGQGLFVLDQTLGNASFSSTPFYLTQLVGELEGWEADGSSWQMDHYIDRVLTTEGNVSVWNGTHWHTEPLVDRYCGGNATACRPPYNSLVAAAPDNKTTFFHMNTTHPNSSATFDFGKLEEAVGNGHLGFDLTLYFTTVLNQSILDNLTILVSEDNNKFGQVVSYGFAGPANTTLRVEVDQALASVGHSLARYLRLEFTDLPGFSVGLDAVGTDLVNRRHTAVTAVDIGPLYLDYDRSVRHLTDPTNEPPKLMAGTLQGYLYAFSKNSSSANYSLVWDSWRDDEFSYGTAVWDLTHLLGEGDALPISPANGGRPEECCVACVGREYSEPSLTSWIFEGDEHGVAADGIYGGFVAPFCTFENLEFNPDNPYDTWCKNGDEGNVAIIGSEFGMLLEYLSDGTMVSPTDSTLLEIPNQNYGGATKLTPTLGPLLPYGEPNNLFVGVWQGNEPGFDPTQDQLADVHLYDYDNNGRFVPHYPNHSLATLEQTGLLRAYLQQSTDVPVAASADVDGDGDYDIIVSNGQALYLVRNVGGLSGEVWELDQTGFFDAVNSQLLRGVTSVYAFDMDKDGTVDVGVSDLFSWTSPVSHYTFLNKGSYESPHWVESSTLVRNPSSSLSSQGYVKLSYYEPVGLVAMHQTGTSMRVLTNHDGSASQWDAREFNRYVVATNPYVATVDLKISTSSDPTVWENHGYHVAESWSTRGAFFEGWANTVAVTNLNNNSQPEVLTGDFASSMYLFEHLGNNTFRVAYETPKLSYDTMYNDTAFGGEGLFNISQRTYAHASQIVTGVDLNQNGREEFVVTFGWLLYIFEHGNRTDEYSLLHQVDLRNSSYVGQNGFPSDQIGAVAFVADRSDLPADVTGVLSVLAGPVVAEVTYSNVTGFGYSDFTPLNTSDLAITVALYEDLTGDSLPDLIVGAVNQTSLEGVVVVVDYSGSTFAHPYVNSSLTGGGAINDLVVTDQDYDGNKEVVLATDQVLYVWEWNKTGFFVERAQVKNRLDGSDVEFTQTTPQKANPTDLVTTKLLDLVNGSTLMIYTNHSGSNITLHQRLMSSGEGQVWGPSSELFAPANSFSAVASSVSDIRNLSLVEDLSGVVWLVWDVSYLHTDGTNRDEMYGSRLIHGNQYWEDPQLLATGGDNPVVWLYNQTHIGFGYVNMTGTILYHFHDLSGKLNQFDLLTALVMPDVGNKTSLPYRVYSFDAQRQSDNRTLFILEVSVTNSTRVPRELVSRELYQNGTWTEPAFIMPRSFQAQNPVLASLPNGDVAVFFNTSSSLPNLYMLVYQPDRGWTGPSPVPQLPELEKVYDPTYGLVYKFKGGTTLTHLTLAGFSVVPREQGLLYSLDLLLANSTVFQVETFVGEVSNLVFTELVGKPLNHLSALVVGDTDADYHLELGFAAGNYAMLVEILSAGDRWAYDLTWRSPMFPTPVQAIAIGDINGNGVSEVVAASGGGYVQSYEVLNLPEVRPFPIIPNGTTVDDFGWTDLILEVESFVTVDGDFMVLALHDSDIADPHNTLQGYVVGGGTWTSPVTIQDTHFELVTDPLTGDTYIIALNSTELLVIQATTGVVVQTSASPVHGSPLTLVDAGLVNYDSDTTLELWVSGEREDTFGGVALVFNDGGADPFDLTTPLLNWTDTYVFEHVTNGNLDNSANPHIGFTAMHQSGSGRFMVFQGQNSILNLTTYRPGRMVFADLNNDSIDELVTFADGWLMGRSLGGSLLVDNYLGGTQRSLLGHRIQTVGLWAGNLNGTTAEQELFVVDDGLGLVVADLTGKVEHQWLFTNTQPVEVVFGPADLTNVTTVVVKDKTGTIVGIPASTRGEAIHLGPSITDEVVKNEVVHAGRYVITKGGKVIKVEQ